MSEESKYAKPSINVRAPIWPADKQITLQEAFHFAACARRVGKMATSEKRSQSEETGTEEHEGIEVTDVMADGLGMGDCNSSNDQDLQHAWKALACCDGLCGAPLGLVVKESYDCTVSWLCSTLTFGGQVLVEVAEKRSVQNKAGEDGSGDLLILSSDFDCRPQGYERDETEVVVHPIPIPAAIASLKEVVNSGSTSIRSGMFFLPNMLHATAWFRRHACF